MWVRRLAAIRMTKACQPCAPRAPVAGRKVGVFKETAHLMPLTRCGRPPTGLDEIVSLYAVGRIVCKISITRHPANNDIVTLIA